MLIFFLVLGGLIVLAGVLLALCFMKSVDQNADKDVLDWEYGILTHNKKEKA